MKLKSLLNSSLLALIIINILAIPSYASGAAPEIPAGFGPMIVTGIVLATTAFKSFINKN
jgi:hypothetical protein